MGVFTKKIVLSLTDSKSTKKKKKVFYPVKKNKPISRQSKLNIEGEPLNKHTDRDSFITKYSWKSIFQTLFLNFLLEILNILYLIGYSLIRVSTSNFLNGVTPIFHTSNVLAYFFVF